MHDAQVTVQNIGTTKPYPTGGLLVNDGLEHLTFHRPEEVHELYHDKLRRMLEEVA